MAGKNTGNKFYELFEKNQPSQEFQTIYRAIEVANDLVLRTLIINARIEGTILIKDMEVGNKVCANGLPQNSNKVLTREYQSMGMRGGGDQTLSLNKYNGSYRLSENADGHIKELESSFSTLENKIRALERVFDEANRLFRKNGDNAENLKQLIISKSSQVRSLKRTVTTLKDSINVQQFNLGR